MPNVDRPMRALARAASQPACPKPTTITSYCVDMRITFGRPPTGAATSLPWLGSRTTHWAFIPALRTGVELRWACDFYKICPVGHNPDFAGVGEQLACADQRGR